MPRVICGSQDSRNETSSDLWHIPRYGDGQPLCRARLGGRIRTAKKASANCTTCRHYNNPSDYLYPSARELLLRIASGENVLLRDGYDSGRLDDMNYVVWRKNGKCALTPRGEIAVAELHAPAPWYDVNTRLCHEREAFSEYTRCDICLGMMQTEDLEHLLKVFRNRGRRTINCLACLAKPQNL